jgi:drug/metabolite transporter (DMT)-like permease
MRKESVDFRDPQDYKMLMIRSVISGLNGMAASFFQMYLPLTVYYTINASLTIFAFLLNYFLYGIQFTMNQVKAVIIALVGIALVINGRAIYHFFDDEY